MTKKISLGNYLALGSMLFGLFFGAGNLIFPVHMGQEAGSHVALATLGFLVTGVGLPFLGVIAIGFSKSQGLHDLASRIHPLYGTVFTLLLYLTIGPFFALPRTATVSFEISFSNYATHPQQALLLFTALFFIVALVFSLYPGKIMVWIGKILNPLFLVFLALLIGKAFLMPMGTVHNITPIGDYGTHPFLTGFTEGYNTMDALASLAFGIIVIQALKDLGVEKPKQIAVDTFKSGIITLVLMSIIYGSLAYIGTFSSQQFAVSKNGGIALAQIAHYYFGSAGSILLAVIVTLACLKTAIGLITACGETFHQLFPKIPYKLFVVGISLFGVCVANFGLTELIQISLPMLMFLYPLAITLIFLALFSPLFNHQRIVYVMTTIFTLIPALIEGLKTLPSIISTQPEVFRLTQFFDQLFPFSSLGMNWVIPALLGLSTGLILSTFSHKITIRRP